MSEIRINSIKVKNYRSFGEEQEFTFPDREYKKPIAIVGYNNSGKTNLIRAIKYALYETTNEDTFELNDFHNCKWDNTPHFEVRYSRLYELGERPHINTTNVIVNENRISIVTNETDGSQSKKFDVKKRECIYYINFHNIKEEIKTQRTSWGNLTSFLAKHIKSIVDTDTSMAAKQEDYESEVELATNKVLKNSKLSAFIKKIKDNYSSNLRNNSCELKFGLPDFEDIFLQMIFKVGLNGDNANLIPIDHFGDGYISMFVMAVIQSIAESNTDAEGNTVDKCLFLFEEPESFLHENHQEYFYKTVLCNLAEKGHQVIYTTHSDRMVDAFETKSIIRIEFDEMKKQTVKKHNKLEGFNSIMPTADGGKELISFANFNSYIKSVEPNFNRILFSRKVVLVEGPNDILAYKIAIEKEVEKIKGKKYAETYLSFLNIAFVVHHGKATAYLLIDLCKHFGLDHFVINDWDFDNDFVDELNNCQDENGLAQIEFHKTYGYKNKAEKTNKSMITTNWKLLKSAGIEKIHFNIPKLEAVLDYQSDDKDSFGILNTVQTLTRYPETFLPTKLKEFLELDKLIA